ncbi:hypothetical protein DdX_14787 [Ditylenchus destructor]|uniref:Uncharacterized protein n=1 Tax=Ditylenchus destructor TaxID=166010 RepID=A0AAD4MTV2_9BILA|nr:hypothetical protein DdX_14787 [Ditylenchus destructor]
MYTSSDCISLSASTLSSGVLSSQYFTQSDTEVEEEIYRNKQKQLKTNANRGIQGPGVRQKQNVTPKECTFRKRRSLSSTHLRSEHNIYSNQPISPGRHRAVRDNSSKENGRYKNLASRPVTRRYNKHLGAPYAGAQESQWRQHTLGEYYRATRKNPAAMAKQTKAATLNRAERQTPKISRNRRHSNPFVLMNDELEGEVETCTSPVLLDYQPAQNTHKRHRNTATPVQYATPRRCTPKSSGQPKNNGLFFANTLVLRPPSPPMEMPPPVPQHHLPGIGNKENQRRSHAPEVHPYLMTTDQLTQPLFGHATDSGCDDPRPMAYGDQYFDPDSDYDGAETQFMNISDKTYENLRNHDSRGQDRAGKGAQAYSQMLPILPSLDTLVMCKRERKVLAEVQPSTSSNPSTSNSQHSSNSCTTSSIGSDSAGIREPKCESMANPMAMDDEPELYGRLVHVVLTETRRLAPRNGNWRSILEAQRQFDTLLGIGSLRLFDLSLPSLEQALFCHQCATFCQKISQQLRHSQRRSLRDYNLQVEKMHRILAELKSSADNPVAHGLGNAAGHKSTPFQKLLVKIRSIF